ncbi:MAG: hypothetical protein U1F56_12910 [Rubrivivax sp.]
MTFESTLPMGAAELQRASAFRRDMDAELSYSDDERVTSRLSSLNPSLHQDLLRFEQKGRQSELLEVMAGAVRHSHAVTVYLQLREHVLALTVFPVHRLVHCQLPMEQFFELQLTDLEVMRVEKAAAEVPDLQTLARSSVQPHYAPLGKLLWELSLRGARDELLPEISGQAAYRITPTLDLSTLELTGSLASACEKLKRQTTNLREISEWPGFDRTRAMRMLNGLYLQAGLMVSRTHPAATNDGWFSGRP